VGKSTRSTNFGVKRSNRIELNEMEVRKIRQLKISNTFASLENLCGSGDK
jgi:hypothetical protein